MRLAVLLAFLFVSAFAEKTRFDNYSVYTIVPKNEEHLSVLKFLEGKNDFNFWTDVTSINTPVDVMVAPQDKDEFEAFIGENLLEFEIKIENVQSLIDAEELTTRSRTKNMDWVAYHTLEEIYDWIDGLAKKYPENVKVVTAGKTYEGREIKAAEITFENARTGIFIESGMHAREWIGPAVTTWMVHQILENKTDPIFRNFNYFYAPILNPDGYVYSWEKNRLWRKTRSPHAGRTTMCYGVDINRNWDFHWDEAGSSVLPCSETYAGPTAFSEEETRTFSEYLKKVVKKMKTDIFIAYHSYSQLILYPWGYTKDPAPKDKIFNRVATVAAKALEKVHGKKFEVGAIAKILYPTSGTSIEWYYATFNGTVNFAYELRDKGKNGFVLPADQIIPSGEETLASLKGILEEYKKIKS